ncbi:hypothetical protein [Polycladidibacter hongkongensis]|uniref:hypothetical protein n=1 Tax=Polycladidibacter hongkongensis TaxID=1647556 RepID=UPI000A60E2F8|nr:hypothetical protein [Pseudovibrio hongkongensis]
MSIRWKAVTSVISDRFVTLLRGLQDFAKHQPVVAGWGAGAACCGLTCLLIIAYSSSTQTQPLERAPRAAAVVTLPAAGDVHITGGVAPTDDFIPETTAARAASIGLTHAAPAGAVPSGAEQFSAEVEALRFALVNLRLEIEQLQQQNQQLSSQLQDKTRQPAESGALSQSSQRGQSLSPTPPAQVDEGSGVGRAAKSSMTNSNLLTLASFKPAASSSQVALGATKIKRTRFALDLGTFTNLKALQLHWNKLQQLHAEMLSDLALDARPLGAFEGSPGYRLVAGPLYNAADAALLCATLGKSGEDCKPTAF